MKQFVNRLALFTVCANTLLFLSLAYFHRLNMEGKAVVFIDFWGRLTIYSFWIIGYAFYVKYLSKVKLLQYLALALVCANIPFFLLLAYLDKINSTPQNLVFIDFWGRVTVYSLWFILYEAYKSYMNSPDAESALSRDALTTTQGKTMQ